MIGEILKQTDEIRVETEKEAQELIDYFKQKAREDGFELTSYTSTHKVKKDDNYYLIKISKKWY